MGKIAITRCDWRRASSPCGSDDNAGSGEEAGSGNAAVPLCQRSMFATLLSQQCSAFTAFQAYLWYRAWVAQRHHTMSPLVQPGLHNSPFLFLSKPDTVNHPGESFFKTIKANTRYNSNNNQRNTYTQTFYN